MGWKLNALLFLFAIWSLNAGAWIIGVPLVFYLVNRWWSGRDARPRVGGSQGVGPGRKGGAVLGIILILLSFIAIGAGGTYSPLVFGGSGVLLLAASLFPGMFSNSVRGAFYGSASLLRHLSGKPIAEPTVASVELTQLPLEYVEDRKADPREKSLKFQRLVQTLAEFGTPVEFAIVFSGGSGRILFSLTGRDARDRLQGLLQVVRSQLPEFRAEPTELPAVRDSISVPIEGVPDPTTNPIGPLAKFFVENRLEGEYRVMVSPAHVDPVSKILARRKQRGLARTSAVQHHDEDATSTEVDHPRQVELQESVKALDRLSARRPVRVSVMISSVDEDIAVRAARVLIGTVSKSAGVGGLKVGRPRFGRPSYRHSTLMLPSEAATYLWLPQMSIGQKVVPSAEFQAPPKMEGEVVLGDIVTLSGRSGQQVKISLDQLAKHVFVTGMTGSGKTTSCFGLLLQLHRMGVPFLVVEPVKSEYRSLLAAVPDLQVFTIGDEEAAPFRLNIFEPPAGVKVRAHLENLEAVWNSSFVSYAPLPYVVKQVFAEAYRACGWDLARNTRGKAVTFEDVEVQVERVVRGLGYERNVTMDVEAALKTRLRSLSLGSKGPLFGGISSTPLDVVLGGPTVVELKGIQNDEEKAFVAALLMMNVAALAQSRGTSEHLRHFTLIEEAHRLLPNVSTEKGDPEAADPRRRMVEQFGNMLAELRAYGEGLAVVEQIPTKILPDAIKNTATKIVHRVPAEDDRKVLAGAMNATRQQAAVFTALKPGEAVLSVEGHPVPLRVEVEDIVAKLGVPVGEVSDGDVKRQMADFYLRYPLPKDPPKARDARVRELVESEAFRNAFLLEYRVWLKTGDVGPLRDLLVREASGFAREKSELMDWVGGILTIATGYYLPFVGEDKARFPVLFLKAVGKTVGSG